MLELVAKGIQFWSEASRSNWFGLGCPLHCTQPSLASLVLSFVLGVILWFRLDCLLPLDLLDFLATSLVCSASFGRTSWKVLGSIRVSL